MYSAERRQEILKLVIENSRVSVADLSTRFEVSESSIRRDLAELHRLGLVQRTYGGAIGLANPSAEAPFSERVVARREEKDRIGRAAAQLVQPGDTIFVDGGTTTECMLSYLPNLESEVQYIQPNFRVKTGKYFTRLDAQADYMAIKRYFPGAIVVPDKIPIN